MTKTLFLEFSLLSLYISIFSMVGCEGDKGSFYKLLLNTVVFSFSIFRLSLFSVIIYRFRSSCDRRSTKLVLFRCDVLLFHFFIYYWIRRNTFTHRIHFMDLCSVFIIWSDITFNLLSYFTSRSDVQFEEISKRQTT